MGKKNGAETKARQRTDAKLRDHQHSNRDRSSRRMGKTAGAVAIGSDHEDCAGRGFESDGCSAVGGIFRQLIESLIDQRASHEAQIQRINEQIQDIEALRDELIGLLDDNEE
jgi:hypothetical protein